MPGNWLWIDGRTRIRKLDDGTWQGQRRVDMREHNRVLRENAELRNSGGPRPTGGGVIMSRVPGDFHLVMESQAGDDPEKRKAFLRDHPALLTASPRQLGIPTLKPIRIFPGGKKRCKGT